MEDRYVLNFLLVEGEEGWWARCLEHDFVTQADTLCALYSEIERSVAGYLMISVQEGTKPFSGLGRAATEYWKMFADAQLSLRPRPFMWRAVSGALNVDVPIPELQELRVAAAS